MENFLAINKNYFGRGLKSIDLLILSQIEEFERNGCQCYVTNEQFSEMFGESLYAIKTSLDKLEGLGHIKRDTFYVNGNGRANRQRVIKMVGCPSTYQDCENNGRLNSSQWKVDSQPIKDKEKDNIKDNIFDIDFKPLKEEIDFIFPNDKNENIFNSGLSSDTEYEIWKDYRDNGDIDRIMREYKIDKDIAWKAIQEYEDSLPFA